MLSNIGDVALTTPVLEHCPHRGAILSKEKRAGWRGGISNAAERLHTQFEASANVRRN